MAGVTAVVERLQQVERHLAHEETIDVARAFLGGRDPGGRDQGVLDRVVGMLGLNATLDGQEVRPHLPGERLRVRIQVRAGRDSLGEGLLSERGAEQDLNHPLLVNL